MLEQENKTNNLMERLKPELNFVEAKRIIKSFSP